MYSWAGISRTVTSRLAGNIESSYFPASREHRQQLLPTFLGCVGVGLFQNCWSIQRAEEAFVWALLKTVDSSDLTSLFQANGLNILEELRWLRGRPELPEVFTNRNNLKVFPTHPPTRYSVIRKYWNTSWSMCTCTNIAYKCQHFWSLRNWHTPTHPDPKLLRTVKTFDNCGRPLTRHRTRSRETKGRWKAAMNVYVTLLHTSLYYTVKKTVLYAIPLLE